jgi:hypothetical protein
MTCGFIYKIQFPNGKHYIGITTTSLKQRQNQHKQCAKNGDTKCLYNALRKYKIVDTFELIEIDTADTLEELCEKEIRYIAEYNSYYMNGNGYNMTYGGEGTNGYVFTEEDNLKNSEAKKKYHKEHPEAREQMSEIKKQYYENNPEAREQMSEIKKQYYENNPEARERMSEIKKQFYIDNPEAVVRNREAQKNRSPEWIKKKLDKQGNNKPFDVFTKDGTFIKTFTYQFEAKEYLQKEYNITSKIEIGKVLAGNAKSSGGFIFKYK